MPADDLPIEPDRLPDAPHEKTPIAARERRETDWLITDWERETRQLGHALALMTLDVSAMTGPKWAHRFIIAVDPVVEDSSFLFYGARFASLLGLPETPNHSIPIVAQLPTQYIPVFTRGCIPRRSPAQPSGCRARLSARMADKSSTEQRSSA